jgi:hypothetical protein
VKIALSEISTPAAAFAEDVSAYAAAAAARSLMTQS